MQQKRKLHLIGAGIGVLVLLGLITIFVDNYIYEGYDAPKDSLFAMLSNIDYRYLFTTLLVVSAYMAILDGIVLFTHQYWLQAHRQKPIVIKHLVRNYWRRYRNMHVAFILLSIFLTIGIAAPAKLMNTFTAIVSISVLVSSLAGNRKS